MLSIYVARAAVPGADQGAPQQPRGARRSIDGVVRPALENVAERRTGRVGRRDRRAHHPGRARPRGVAARRRSRCRARRASSHRLNLPGKLADCRRPTRPRASCSSSRATPPAARPSRAATARPGDPAAARQGAQRRAGVDREGARRTRSSRTSSARSAAASARTSTSRSCATARSSC